MHALSALILQLRFTLIPLILTSLLLYYVIIYAPSDIVAKYQLPLFGVFSFFSFAFFIQLIDVLFIGRMRVGTKRVMFPSLIRILINFFLYSLVLYWVLTSVLGVSVSKLFPVLTSTAVLGVILGLALRDTLGNIFAGLALQMEGPVAIGDWVKLKDTEGRVKEMNWRSVTLVTRRDELVVIPNSVFAATDFKNFSQPTTDHILEIEFGVSYEHEPGFVRRVAFETLKAVPEIQQEPQPYLCLSSFDDFKITYHLYCHINDYTVAKLARSKAMIGLWYHFKRHGIEIPLPQRDVRQREVTSEEERIRKNVKSLSKVDFIARLGKEEIEYLASKVRAVHFAEGETIFREGDHGNTFYLIQSGAVEVSLGDGDYKQVINVLREGDYFGEMSLLTGEPRKATATALEESLLIEVRHNTFKDMLERNPSCIEPISELVSSRMTGLYGAKDALEKEKERLDREQLEREKLRSSRLLLNKIRSFFNL